MTSVQPENQMVRRIFSSFSGCSLKSPSRMWWKHDQPSKVSFMSGLLHCPPSHWIKPPRNSHSHLDVQIPSHHRAANSYEYSYASYSYEFIWIFIGSFIFNGDFFPYPSNNVLCDPGQTVSFIFVLWRQSQPSQSTTELYYKEPSLNQHTKVSFPLSFQRPS